jgi:hypothetical protein
MMFTGILIASGLIALVFFLWALRRDRSAADLKPLDLDAFLNLVDKDEEEYLRANLPPSEFRRVQRKRLRAASEYVSGVAYNAASLMRQGEVARRSSDAAIAGAGERLVDRASQVRMRALLAQARISFGVLLPGVRLNPAGVVESYRQVTDLALKLRVPADQELRSRAG